MKLHSLNPLTFYCPSNPICQKCKYRAILTLEPQNIEKSKFQKKHTKFWTPGLLEGVLSNRPCQWSVCPWSVFKYLRDRSLVFLIFCTKLGYHKGTKVTAWFFKIKSWVFKYGKKPTLGALMFLISLHPVIKSFWKLCLIYAIFLFK